MSKEIWKDIKGYESRYKISNLGRVKSLLSNKILTNNLGSAGYYQVSLYKDDKGKSTTIHRLISIHFIDNPLNKPCVNHIDSNRKNNNIENLEWCTQGENLQHARNTGRLTLDSLKKKVKSYNPITKEVIVYDYLNLVKKSGFAPGLVCYCAKGIIKNKTHKGLIWDYV
jgi:hypothetical protein